MVGNHSEGPCHCWIVVLQAPAASFNNYCSPSLLSVSVIRRPDQKQLRGESIYLAFTFGSPSITERSKAEL